MNVYLKNKKYKEIAIMDNNNIIISGMNISFILKDIGNLVILKSVPLNLVSFKSAPFKSASLKSALLKSAPFKLAS